MCHPHDLHHTTVRHGRIGAQLHLGVGVLRGKLRQLQAQRRKVSYTFLFMKASGSQLRQITPLIESGAIRPVIDAFAATVKR